MYLAEGSSRVKYSQISQGFLTEISEITHRLTTGLWNGYIPEFAGKNGLLHGNLFLKKNNNNKLYIYLFNY